eukprot:1116259-Prorocentrum_minimum.AAC.1
MNCGLPAVTVDAAGRTGALARRAHAVRSARLGVGAHANRVEDTPARAPAQARRRRRGDPAGGWSAP